MEQHVGLLAVDGNIACCPGLDRVRWRGNVLGPAVLFTGLCRICLDGGVLAKVGVGNK